MGWKPHIPTIQFLVQSKASKINRKVQQPQLAFTQNSTKVEQGVVETEAGGDITHTQGFGGNGDRLPLTSYCSTRKSFEFLVFLSWNADSTYLIEPPWGLMRKVDQ